MRRIAIFGILINPAIMKTKLLLFLPSCLLALCLISGCNKDNLPADLDWSVVNNPSRFPLKAHRYAAVGAPSNNSYHRRTINFLDEKFWTSERYAVDLIGLDAGNRYREGRQNTNSDYYGYEDIVYSTTSGVFDRFILHGNITGYDRTDGLIRVNYLTIQKEIISKNFSGDVVIGFE